MSYIFAITTSDSASDPIELRPHAYTALALAPRRPVRAPCDRMQSDTRTRRTEHRDEINGMKRFRFGVDAMQCSPGNAGPIRNEDVNSKMETIAWPLVWRFLSALKVN